jgi:hypothetical protein
MTTNKEAILTLEQAQAKWAEECVKIGVRSDHCDALFALARALIANTVAASPSVPVAEWVNAEQGVQRLQAEPFADGTQLYTSPSAQGESIDSLPPLPDGAYMAYGRHLPAYTADQIALDSALHFAEHELDAANRRIAERFALTVRTLLAHHNLKRHRVCFGELHGAIYFLIDGRPHWDRQHGASRLHELFKAIDNAISDDPDWNRYLPHYPLETK